MRENGAGNNEQRRLAGQELPDGFSKPERKPGRLRCEEQDAPRDSQEGWEAGRGASADAGRLGDIISSSGKSYHPPSLAFLQSVASLPSLLSALPSICLTPHYTEQVCLACPQQSLSY